MTNLHASEFKCNDIGTTLQIQVRQGYASTSKGGGWSLIAPIFRTGVAKFIVQISVATMDKGNIGILLMSLKVPTASDCAHCTVYTVQTTGVKTFAVSLSHHLRGILSGCHFQLLVLF